MTHQNLRLGKCWKLFWATLNQALDSEDFSLADSFLQSRLIFLVNTLSFHSASFLVCPQPFYHRYPLSVNWARQNERTPLLPCLRARSVARSFNLFARSQVAWMEQTVTRLLPLREASSRWFTDRKVTPKRFGEVICCVLAFYMSAERRAILFVSS